ncbi:MAG: hypothetical protein Q8Q60_03595 [Candidatus Chromulinivorax sp.]|nr:hypothetical protein [Candidatus Chromulinivorax sp.]
MKKIIALGIFLAACNVYANDIDNEFDQEESMTVADDCQTRQDAYEDMTSQEESDDQETQCVVTLKKADGSEETIAVQTINLVETKEVFNSETGVEFLATMNLTPDQAFDSIVTLLGQVQNRTMEINGTVSPIEGVSFAIYNTAYFIKSSEFMTVQSDSIVDVTAELN